MIGAFPAAIIGLGAGLNDIGDGDGTIGIGDGDGTIGIGDGLISIGGWFIGMLSSIGTGDGFIITIDAGDPESITLLEGVVRVSRPTPTRALSTGRGDGETFGPLL
jgi:hypothetical protein